MFNTIPTSYQLDYCEKLYAPLFKEFCRIAEKMTGVHIRRALFMYSSTGVQGRTSGIIVSAYVIEAGLRGACKKLIVQISPSVIKDAYPNTRRTPCTPRGTG